MSQGKSQTQIPGQAGSPGKPEDVGLEVGGVHSNAQESWTDLWTLKAETRQQLRSAGRDAACSYTMQRSEGLGDGSQEISSNARYIAKPRRNRSIGSGACMENWPGWTCWSTRSNWLQETAGPRA
jgi:hypothetical protein